MNYKKQISIFLGISFFGVLFGILGLCQPDLKMICMGKYYEMGLAVWVLSASIFISTLPLLFLKEKVYKSWRIFALWAIPLSLLWIFLTPIHGSGGILATGREYITFLVSGLFLTISYILIAYKTWKWRN
jgi:CBS domain containing-hemolysin-like protein